MDLIVTNNPNSIRGETTINGHTYTMAYACTKQHRHKAMESLKKWANNLKRSVTSK